LKHCFFGFMLDKDAFIFIIIYSNYQR